MWTIRSEIAFSLLLTDAMAKIIADSDTILTGAILAPRFDDWINYGITNTNAIETDPRNTT